VLSRLAPRALLGGLLQAYATACSRKDAERFDLPTSHRAATRQPSRHRAVRAAMP
jgi:hypothetical protein